MDDNVLLANVMRALGAAWRAMRLYPAASPMTLQAAQAVAASVEEYLQAEPSLKLDVVREGFILRGLEGVLTAPGVPDLTDALGAHGIGEVHFLAPPSAEEVVAFLSATHERPNEAYARGALQAALTQAGVGSIKLIGVVLSKIETPPEIPEEEADKFLAELAADSERLAVWLRSLLASDDEGLAEGILVLANAAADVRVFGRTMAAAFLELDQDDKDRLLEISIDLEPVRHVLVEMLANLSETELAAAIRGGRYGTSLMAMAFAVTELPVRERGDALVAEVEAALRSADASDEKIALLDHVIALRRAGTPEPALIDAQPVYRATLEAARLRPEHLASLGRAAASRRRLDSAGVGTVLHLLETAEDFRSYSRVLDALALSVPHLLEERDPALAMYVVRQISAQADSPKPWPELQDRIDTAMAEVCDTRTMAALVAMSSEDENAVAYAKELVTYTGDRAAHSLAAAAVTSEAEDAMAFAQAVVGRRLAELLAPLVPKADDRHAAKLAELFAADGGQWCLQALAQLVARPEDRVRSETARGLAAAGGPAMTRFMPTLLRDESRAVSGLAARVLARNGSDEAIALLGNRLAELEGEDDLPAAREIIALLANSGSPHAAAALKAAAERGGGLRRKGWRAEIRRLASEALATIDARGAG